jgi:signal transduction histidine kinase
MNKGLVLGIIFFHQLISLYGKKIDNLNIETENFKKTIFNNKTSVKNYIKQFDFYLFKSNTEINFSIEVFKEAIVKAQESKDKFKIAWSNYFYSEALNFQYKFNEALIQLNFAKTLFEGINEKCGYNRCAYLEGEVLIRNSNYINAIPLIQKALHGAESCQDTFVIIRSLFNLGFISGIRKDLNRTITYYLEGIRLAKIIGWYSKEVDLMRTLGNAYKEKGNINLALITLKQADDLLKKKVPFNNYLKAVILVEIGLIEVDNFKKVDEGLSKYLISVKIFDSLKRYNWSSYMRAIIAEANLAKGNYEKAMKIAKEGYNLSLIHNLIKEKADNLDAMYKIAVKQKKFKLALDYHIEMTNISNSIINVESIDKMISKELNFAHEKKLLADSIEFVRKEAAAKAEQEKQAFRNEALIKTIITWFASILILLLLILIFYIVYINNKKQKVQLEFTHKLIRTQENERIRISRDLHDGIGQQLVLLKNIVHQKSETELVKMIEGTLVDMRSITHALHPFVIKQFGISEALKKLLKNADDNSSVFFTIEIDNISGIFDEDTELNIYRIIQELINNLIKHSGSPSAEIVLQNRINEVQITIKDYGKGFSLKEAIQNQSLGMKTIKERCDMIGAQLSIQSAPQLGTLITLILSIPTK